MVVAEAEPIVVEGAPNAFRARLASAAYLASTLDPALGARLDAALASFDDPQIRIAFGGFFSGGKSTLINALLGRSILPTLDLPETAAPAYIRAGEADHASYVSAGDVEDIACAADAIRARTSLYQPDGERRDAPLGARIDLAIANAPIGANVTWIDTPGRNDAESTILQSDAVLRDADHLIWVSSTRFPLAESEMHDIAAWVERRGADAITLVINAALPAETPEAWHTWQAESLPFIVKQRVDALRTQFGVEIEWLAVAAQPACTSPESFGLPALRTHLATLEHVAPVQTCRAGRIAEHLLPPLRDEAETRRAGLEAADSRRAAFLSALTEEIAARVTLAQAAFDDAANRIVLANQDEATSATAIEQVMASAAHDTSTAIGEASANVAQRVGANVSAQNIAAAMSALLPIPPAPPASKLPLYAAIGGAILGSVILPVLGTLIGGIAGFVIGTMIANKKKTEAVPDWRRRAIAFATHFDRLRASAPHIVFAQSGASLWPAPKPGEVETWARLRDVIHDAEAAR